ncbi:MAG: InlB B-repeat-containing protein, partial [Clostridiales bacterium]|nr:InlB B-repeat-containing protein [Clostridiales bacterium]
MKRSKILLSVLAAAVFATSAGALVACGDVEIPIKPAEKPSESQTTEYTVTFSGLTGANATKTTVGGKLTGTMPTATAPEGKEFKGWALTQNASSAAIRTDNYKTYPFTGTTTTITLYPVFADKQQEEDPPVENPPASEEYTVTFSGLTGANATKTTVGGKLIGTMPTAPEPEGKEFKGWALTQNANSAAIRTDNYTTYSFTGTTTTITLYPVFADKQQVEDPPTTDEFTIT